MTQLALTYPDPEALAKDYQSNLRKGRAFVPGAAGVCPRERCELRLEHPSQGRTLTLPAEAVWIGDAGVGLELLALSDDQRRALESFARPEAPPLEAHEAAPSSTELGGESRGEAGPRSDPGSQGGRKIRNLHDRVRELSIEERDALARKGSLPERTALHRRYGSSVFEALLHNPQITTREVGAIAKSGSLPPALLNLIAGNRSWLADASVSGALLASPRVSGPLLDRVLRALPPSDLARLANSVATRHAVRSAAKRLVRR